MRRRLSDIGRKVRDQRGAVLIMTLAFTLIIIVVGLAFMEAGSSEARNAHERWASNNAFWLAEAGYQRFAGEEWANAAWSGSPPRDPFFSFGDTLGGGSYWIVVRDTTIGGVANGTAVHINTNGTTLLPVGGTDAQRRIDISAHVMAAAFDSDVVFALGDVDVGSASTFDDIDGKIHADGNIDIPPSREEPGNWGGAPIKPPALYTEIDSLGGSTVSYYYVQVSSDLDSAYVLDRNQLWDGVHIIPPSQLSTTGMGANQHALIKSLDGATFDWNSGLFPIEAGKQTVIVNFAELNMKPVDLLMDFSVGSQSIKSSIINTRYVGPNTYDERIKTMNWRGGTTQLRGGITFEPVNGLAMGVYDFEKVAGGGTTNVGTVTWPALTYVTDNFLSSTGDVNFYGMVLCLGDVSFSGTTNMNFNAGFIDRLPSSMNNVWLPGVTASVEILSWKEIARQ